jgi:hypothetical protein
MTPQRPENAPVTINQVEPNFHQDHNRLQIPATLSPFQPHPQVQYDHSDQSIDQVLQEIWTLERIANRLNDLYSLLDRLIRRRSHRW